MKPTVEELEKQITVLRADLAFARDNAIEWKLKAEEAQETLRDRLAMSAAAGTIVGKDHEGIWEQRQADELYEFADAMLTARATPADVLGRRYYG